MLNVHKIFGAARGKRSHERMQARSWAIACIALLFSSLGYAQWDVKELNMQVDKQLSAQAVFTGNLDNTNHKEIIWYMSGKKADDRISILDPFTGDIRWRTESFYKIDKSTIVVTDIDSDGKDEILFAGWSSSASSPTLYMIKFHAGVFAQTQAPPEKVQTPVSQPRQSPPKVEKASAPPVQLIAEATPSSPDPVPEELIPAHLKSNITYTVTQRSLARVDIYNGNGDLVRTLVNDESDPGTYITSWDGTNDQGERLKAGNYFYKVTIGKATQARKAVLFN